VINCFFGGWHNPTSPEVPLGFNHVVLAVDDRSKQLIEFSTAFTDGGLFASSFLGGASSVSRLSGGAYIGETLY